MPKKTSKNWKYFTRLNNLTAQCNYCGTIIKTSGNTTNLKCHMQSRHKRLFDATRDIEEPTTLNQKKPTKFNKRFTFEVTDEDPLSPSPEPATNALAPKSAESISEICTLESLKTVNDNRCEETCDKNSDEISNSIVYMICRDMQPISTVQRKGFLKLMNTLAPHYKVPPPLTFEKRIKAKFDIMKDLFKEKIINKKCTITTDCCTNNRNLRYLTATMHFYEFPDKVYNVNLGLIEFEENQYSSEFLGSKLGEMCKELQICDDNIIAVVSNNSPQMDCAVKLTFGEQKHIPCFGHKLNDIAQNVEAQLSKEEGLIEKVKQIVEWFDHSNMANDKLEKQTNDVIRINPTKWNLTFKLLQRFLKLAHSLNSNPLAPCIVNASQIEDIREIIELFQPLDTAVNEICGDKYLTSSLAIPIAFILHKKLKNIHPMKRIGKRLKEHMRSAMEYHFTDIEYHTLLMVATILDPRFKTIYFRDSDQFSQALEFINDNLNQQEQQEQSNIPIRNPSKYQSLFSDHNRNIENKWLGASIKDLDEKHHPELSLYIAAPAEKMHINPLLYWHQMSSTYPLLSNTAKIYLTMVSTSVPPERLFSEAGQIITDARSKLEKNMASKIYFLSSLSDEFWSLND